MLLKIFFENFENLPTLIFFNKNFTLLSSQHPTSVSIANAIGLNSKKNYVKSISGMNEEEKLNLA